MVGRKAAAHASKAQAVIAGGADPVFGLTGAVAFNAKAGTQRMMHCVAKQVPRSGRRGVRFLHGSPEEQLELGTNGAEIRRGRKGKVELQPTWKQGNPVDGTAARPIKR